MNERIRELVAVNRAITSTLDYDEVLRLVVGKTAAFTHADRCCLLLVGPDNLARVVAAHGVDEAEAMRFSVPFDERINVALRELLGFQEEDSFLGVPVIDHGQIKGLLVVYRREAEEPDAEEEFLVTALADQAAIALRHASQYHEVRQLSERKSRLLEAIQANATSYLAYLDRDLCFVEANAAYCQAIGCTRAQIIGRRYDQIFSELEIQALLETVRDTGQPVEIRELPCTLRVGTSTRETRYWHWGARAVHDGGGGVEGLVISASDVTERVLAQRELEGANDRKDEFLAMLAHELRNPLAAISSALEVLRLLDSDDSMLIRVRDAAGRQAAHMARLLDDLLDVSRITQGKIQLRHRTVDIATIVSHAVESSMPLIQSMRHELVVTLPAGPLLTHGDSDRLLQVFSNLLTNAAKYTVPEGHIWLTVQDCGAEAEIRIRDSGIGISADDLPCVFNLFMQSRPALGRAQGGLGIGLTVVKRLVEMHGGRVEAGSEGLQRGSEFVVWLPVLARAADAVLGDGATRPACLPGRRILLVEDNPDTAEMLAAVLKLDGHEVVVSHDGPAALVHALQVKPEVMLLDINLPGLDGHGVARRLRQQMTGPRPLLIALTGYGGDNDRQHTTLSGFDHHLVKPVDLELLRQLLADWPVADDSGQ